MWPYSVLMPLAPWEQPRVLSEALQSLCNQTVKPAQVVVSCDGPLPRSLSQLLQDIQLSIVIINGPGREGVGPVLARGLISCDYELVVRADADDVSVPTRCEKQIISLMNSSETIAMSAAVLEFVDLSQAITGIRRVPSKPSDIAALSRWRNPLNHPATIFKRTPIITAGSYRSCPGFEDYDLWLRLLKEWGPGALANLEEVLVHVRVGPNHLARRHGWQYCRNEVSFLFRCGKENLIPIYHVTILLIIRPPLRIFPSLLLQWLMNCFRAVPENQFKKI